MEVDVGLKANAAVVRAGREGDGHQAVWPFVRLLTSLRSSVIVAFFSEPATSMTGVPSGADAGGELVAVGHDAWGPGVAVGL